MSLGNNNHRGDRGRLIGLLDILCAFKIDLLWHTWFLRVVRLISVSSTRSAFNLVLSNSIATGLQGFCRLHSTAGSPRIPAGSAISAQHCRGERIFLSSGNIQVLLGRAKDTEYLANRCTLGVLSCIIYAPPPPFTVLGYSHLLLSWDRA